MEHQEGIRRWRLILGEDSQEIFSDMNSEAFSTMTEEQWLMDQALSAIYNSSGQFDIGAGQKGQGKGSSNSKISKWLGDIRDLFEKDLVKIIQTDAMEKYGLKELMFEPEILEHMEPNINLAATILLLKDQIPKKSKENVREFIKKIVEEINKLLQTDIKRAISSALNKKQHSLIPSATSLDFKTTIRRGIKNYNKELMKIIPERYYFYEKGSMRPSNKYTIILDIDQSGSMGESVVYSSVISCILASMASLKTRIVAFDTEIIDLTEKSDDPVDLLYGFQLEGGTDINKSIQYCTKYIENPKKTIFFLVSDLMEGGNRGAMLRNLQEMKESGVTVVCLLAISQQGKPYYDASMASRVSSMGIPCFACNPNKLPLLLERVLKGMDLSSFQEEFEKQL